MSQQDIAIALILQWWVTQPKVVTAKQLLDHIKHKGQVDLFKKNKDGSTRVATASLIYSVCEKKMLQEDPLAQFWKTLQLKLFASFYLQMMPWVEKMAQQEDYLTVIHLSRQMDAMSVRKDELEKLTCQALDEETDMLLSCFMELSIE